MNVKKFQHLYNNNIYAKTNKIHKNIRNFGSLESFKEVML